jgi:hypothetical protein
MSSRGVGLYRVALRCYPREFRDDYGPDMVLVFAQQLADESAPRVWVRSVVDLATTVPAQHLEAHMNRARTSFVPMIFIAVSIAALAVVLVTGASNTSGSAVAMAMALLCVSAVCAVLGVVSWSRTRPITSDGSVTAQWWKFLAAGAAAIGAVIVAEAATDIEAWELMMLTLLLAFVTLAAGVVLGLAHVFRSLVSRRPAV